MNAFENGLCQYSIEERVLILTGTSTIRFMKHIVDNVNKLELTFKTIDLEGRVPSTDAIEFLSVEEPYREGRRYSPFVRVRYALNGVKQDKAFPMDVDKGIFLSIDDDVLEEKLRTIAPKIVEILQEYAAR